MSLFKALRELRGTKGNKEEKGNKLSQIFQIPHLCSVRPRPRKDTFQKQMRKKRKASSYQLPSLGYLRVSLVLSKSNSRLFTPSPPGIVANSFLYALFRLRKRPRKDKHKQKRTSGKEPCFRSSFPSRKTGLFCPRKRTCICEKKGKGLLAGILGFGITSFMV